MISKAKMSLIRSLEQKKHRQTEQLYVAEGSRLAEEAMMSATDDIVEIFATIPWIERNTDWVRRYNEFITEISPKELERSSLLHTPNEVIVLLSLGKDKKAAELKAGKFYLLLDNIQDPGNMGTMLRIADWFGFHQVICSPTCVDIYNPKVVQSSMGSIFRTEVVYMPLEELLTSNKNAETVMPVWAAVLGGDDAWTLDRPEVAQTGGLLLIGSEAHGVTPDLLPLCSQKIAIPAYGNAESLNAAMATSILCAILRKHSQQ
jgi:RNA methyltransferase, TrmH family